MARSTITVLIVDDEEPIRILLSGALSKHGMVVMAAASAEEALARDDLASVNVALVDINLQSGRDGHTLVTELATKYPDMSTILMSGRARVDDVIAAFSENVFSFISKPFSSLGEIVILIERAAESKRLEMQNREYANRLADYNRALLEKIEDAEGSLDRYETMIADLFAASTSLGYSRDLEDLLNNACKAIVQAKVCEVAVLLFSDNKFVVRAVGTYSARPDNRGLGALGRERIGQPLRPFEFDKIEVHYGAALLLQSRIFGNESTALTGKSSSLILPLFRNDGTVIGYLSTTGGDYANNPQPAVVNMLSVLLRHAALQAEALALRQELSHRSEELEKRVSERTAELRHSQEIFSRLVNATTDIVYITDESQRIVYLNEAFTHSLGYSRENCIGRTLEKVLLEIAEGNAEDTLTRLLNPDNDSDLVTMPLRRSDGVVRTFEFNRSTIHQGGQLKGSQGIVRDVTERQQLLDQLLAAERLATAGMLAAGVAHEINNPLQAIVSQINAISQKIAANEPAQENIDLVKEALERIRQIVRGLLDLSRPAEEDKTDVQLNKLLRDAGSLMAPQLKADGIVMELELDPKLPTIRANSGELQQVILNLILNAIDAQPAGGSIKVSTSHGNNYVQLCVEDRGIGIDSQSIDRIFEPFYTSKLAGRGTGMGLYVCKITIEKHGGTITVKSDLGKGTAITISLPIG